MLLAFTVPATRQLEEAPYIDYVRRMLAEFERDATAADDQSLALNAMEEASEAVQTPLARVEHALLMPVNFVIVPLFALANAGVSLKAGGGSEGASPALWGSLLGLLVGKPLGVVLASWAAVRTGAAALPHGSSWRQIVGVSVLCGIGFTMSLFVANLAFAGREDLLAATKIGVISASVISALVGAAVIGFGSRPPKPAQPRPSVGRRPRLHV